MLGRLALVALIAACSPPALAVDTAPLCGTADAAGLAPPTIDMATPWVRREIASIAACKGADGVSVGDVDGDGDLDIATACEQGARAIVALNCGCGWTVVTLPGQLSGPEDAVLADVDGDGDLDVVVAESGAQRLQWYRQDDGAWTGPLPIGTGQRFMRAIVPHAGTVIAGGYSTGASIQRFDLRDGAWIATTLSPVGWTKQLLARDGDVLVWDSVGPLRGVRSLNTGRRLTTAAYTQWGTELGGIVVTGTGSADGSTVSILGVGDLPYPSNAGWYHAAALGDIDRDGLLDVVLTHSHADGELSSATWLRAPTWERGEVSGPEGVKGDNPALVDLDGDGDLDVIATEEKTLGLVWYENPGAR